MAKNKHSAKARKRGIQASRLKLEKAMLEAGFTTQAALAEKIAEIEGLDAAPRDLVSKVFREIRVEPHTIGRIAFALGVDAYTLYKSSDEPSSAGQNEFAPLSSNVKGVDGKRFFNNKPQLIYFFVFLLLACVAFISISQFGDTQVQSEQLKQKINIKNLHAKSVAFVGFEQLHLAPFSDAVNHELSLQFKNVSNPESILTENTSPWTLPELLNVEFVVEGELIKQGRHEGLLVYITDSSTRTLLLRVETTDLTINELNVNRFKQRFTKAIDSFMTTENKDDLQINQYKMGLAFYLKSLEQLDKALIEINLLRALNYAQRAKRFVPDYAKVQATICDILVRQSIVSGDKSLLNDAESECLAVDASHEDLAELRFALGQLRRKQGRTDEAVTQYKKALQMQPAYIDARLGLAEAYLNQYQKKQDNQFIELGLEQVRIAGTFSKEFWRIPYVAARLNYFAGDISMAIELSELSKSLSVNTSNVGNLGTYYYCKGEISKAGENYRQLRSLSEPSAFIDHFMGTLSFMQEDFNSAATFFESSLNQMQEGSEGVFEAWLNLADSYRELGLKNAAVDAYRKGIVYAEQYRVIGENTNNIEGHIIYGKINLMLLEDESLSDEVKQSLYRELSDIEPKLTSFGPKLRVMLSWLMLDNKQNAQNLYDQLSKGCPGYIAYPIVGRYFT